MDYALLGKRIRGERLLLRLTIEQLAEKVNKSTNYASLDAKGKAFLLDVVKRYVYYYGKQPE